MTRYRGFSWSKALESLIFLGILNLIYLVQSVPHVKKIIGDTFIFSYVLVPFLWLGLAVAARSAFRLRPAARLRLRKTLNFVALVSAIFYIMLNLGAGFIEGFGKSPYSFTPLGIVFNIFLVGTMLLGSELSRFHIIHNFSGKSHLLVITGLSLVYTFISIPFPQFLAIKTVLDGIQLTGDTVLPLFSENITTSYLSFLGGPLTALIYRGTLETFRWFCPVLPNLGWISKTLLGTIVPFISYILIQLFYLRESRTIKKTDRNKEGIISWLVTSVLAVFIIWFAAGLFPIYPTVIATGSMEPVIKPGDVVLAKKIKGEDVKLGDIINFRLKSVSVTHRVVAVNTETQKTYKTKGDNNTAFDSEPVSPKQIKGKVIYVIPKIGWPTLFIKSGGVSATSDVQ